MSRALLYTAGLALSDTMVKAWELIFGRDRKLSWKGPQSLLLPIQLRTIPQLKIFLDRVHIKYCLAKPYFEFPDYPVVESRELLPSFDSDLVEYAHLPGFSMVALDRPMEYFSEVFQYDILHSPHDWGGNVSYGNACPLEYTVLNRNTQTLMHRLSKRLAEQVRTEFYRKDATDLENYRHLLPYLLEMDRGHVMAKDSYGNFNLTGVYASFPSNLDTEIKRFGLRIGKFKPGDNLTYELNRNFVYQFFMELYGFPIVSERRTSSALFAHRLFKMGERFFVRVLGQTDRVLTTLYTNDEASLYPKVEKVALVRVEKEQKEVIDSLTTGGYFLDPKRRVVILRVQYRQHKYDPNNIQLDRALSVMNQAVIHPFTVEELTGINIIKDVSNMFLRLNDIVRGEFVGCILYKRHEIVENTETHENRLKFLAYWLTKHQRRIIGYADDFFAKMVKVLDTYLLDSNYYDDFHKVYDLFREVWKQYSFIQQARKVRQLKALHGHSCKGAHNYLAKLRATVELLNELKFEIVSYFDILVVNIIYIAENILADRYLIRHYVECKDENLSAYGRDVKRAYGRIVAVVDELKAIRRSRIESHDRSATCLFR